MIDHDASDPFIVVLKMIEALPDNVPDETSLSHMISNDLTVGDLRRLVAAIEDVKICLCMGDPCHCGAND